MNHSLYIHIPFCQHRCAYCDFNTYAGQEDSIPAYVEALKAEIEYVALHAPAPMRVHTVFFGGGTPSLLSPRQLAALLGAVRCRFELATDAEITMEANPGTVTYAALAELRAAGMNRISFGAQSANGEELRMLERTHSFLDVMQAVASARRAGFDNLNVDLIYGLPEQVLATWQSTVRRVLDLQPEHISAYALTLEHGTPFGRWSARGLLSTPDADAAAEMYEWASDAFEQAGYGQYEISNWARVGEGGEHDVADSGERPQYACRHNLQYWRCLPYLGLGASAHGYARGYRYSNVLRIKSYIERMKPAPDTARESGDMVHTTGPRQGTPSFPLSPAAVSQHRQTTRDEMSEFMITGLRLTREGVSLDAFEERFGESLMQAFSREVGELMDAGLLEACGEMVRPKRLRLTRRGRLLGNRVFMRFV